LVSCKAVALVVTLSEAAPVAVSLLGNVILGVQEDRWAVRVRLAEVIIEDDVVVVLLNESLETKVLA
jgi:hypothetical protein